MKRLSGIAARIGPFAIIGGLIASIFAVKLEPTVRPIEEPVLAQRDMFMGVAAPTGDVIWMAGSRGKIVRSDDAGQTWTRQNSTLTSPLQSIVAWKPDVALAVGAAGGIVHTVDGGKTWRPSDYRAAYAGLHFLRARIDSTGRAWVVGEMGSIIVSHDQGATFIRTTEPSDVGINDIAFAASGRGWAVGEGGVVLLADADAQVWVRGDSGVRRSLMATASCSGESGIAVGLEGVILLTADAGATWTPIPPATREHLFAVACADDGRWLAVGDKGAVVSGTLEDALPQTIAVTGGNAVWRTELARGADGWLAVGGDAGFLRNGRFLPFHR